ncbi:MAG TPA: hypothetical protein VG796_28055 [Verrucomicrobiales bacterium]|jgi:hypothetical protein|nr:hypothetical protein [Verrucomicrobiales bacterium]
MSDLSLTEHPVVAGGVCGPPADVRGLVHLLSECAKELAKKGFNPAAPQWGEGGCSLTITSKAFGLEARTGFRRCGGEGEFEWSRLIVSDHTGMVSESGTVSTRKEARDQLQAFLSVLSTVASFQPNE